MHGLALGSRHVDGGSKAGPYGRQLTVQNLDPLHLLVSSVQKTTYRDINKAVIVYDPKMAFLVTFEFCKLPFINRFYAMFHTFLPLNLGAFQCWIGVWNIQLFYIYISLMFYQWLSLYTKLCPIYIYIRLALVKATVPLQSRNKWWWVYIFLTILKISHVLKNYVELSSLSQFGWFQAISANISKSIFMNSSITLK